MATTAAYIDRDEALTAIEAYADVHATDHKAAPSWTAAQIATVIKKLETKAIGRGIAVIGDITRDFHGMNISYGRCQNCGHKLIWYTADTPGGCPYCFAILREPKPEPEKKPGGV